MGIFEKDVMIASNNMCLDSSVIDWFKKRLSAQVPRKNIQALSFVIKITTMNDMLDLSGINLPEKPVKRTSMILVENRIVSPDSNMCITDYGNLTHTADSQA